MPILLLFTGTIPAMAKLDPVPYRAFHSLSQAYGPIVRAVVGIRSIVIFSRYQGGLQPEP
jgi:hypothetical protein